MTPRSLQAVLRTLADAGTPASDAELLRRFLTDDEAAFAELVTRHGRLVWAVCRNLTGSDCEADDAFQATFLVLLKNAKKVRDAGKLSSWLHGVAYKVCAKARQGAKRRTTRERATAHREGNGTVVPESAWDRALAAVHEEVAKLPDTLRVPFVLCCLEGKGVTEAAEQLGWKLGTLSGRLTRAKDAVLAKLDARGLTLGVVAAVGLALPPTAVVAKASALATVGVAIPGSILQLTQGVIGMSMTTVKVLAATVLLTCGLGVSVGTGWVATADAQLPAKVKAKADAADEVNNLTDALKRTQAELEAQQAKLAAEAERVALYAAARARQAEKAERRLVEEITRAVEEAAKAGRPSFKTDKWEYDVVAMTKPFDLTTFAPFVQERENAGWEFLGNFTAPDKLLFRRPVKATSSISPPPITFFLDRDRDVVEFAKPATVVEGFRTTKPAETAAAIEAQIAQLTAKLAELKAIKPKTVTFDKTSSPIDPATLATVLGEAGKKKFAGGKSFNVSHVNGVTTVYGDKEVLEWATGIVKALGGK